MFNMNRGTLMLTTNLDAHKAADTNYWAILIKNELGTYETLLLTEEDLQKIRERTMRNPEDEQQPTWLDRLTRKLGKQPPRQPPQLPGHSEK